MPGRRTAEERRLALVSSLSCAPMILRASGLEPDEWQRRILLSPHPRKHLRVHRQGGKSTAVAAMAVGTALLYPDSDVILGSPSQRQSSELFRKVMRIYRKLRLAAGGEVRAPVVTTTPLKKHGVKPDPFDVAQESALRVEFANGSRIVSLPDNPDAIVGFSAPRLIVIDEAARTSDAFYDAVRPMLATVASKAQLWLISTPKGRRGFFWRESDESGETTARDWEHYTVPIVEPHPRISSAFLREERQHGEVYYRQEYLCEFVENEGSVFDASSVRQCVVDDVAPLF